MEKAIGYIRVSTQEQATSGCSLEVQEAKVRAYAALAGMDLIAVIREEGISGSRELAKRPAGIELVKVLVRKEAIHVIALKLDRLFRDAADALGQVRAWDKAGVALHLIDVGGQTIDTSSAMGRMFLTMMAGFAELERNLIAERTAAALAHKKATGRVYGPTPFGFDRIGGDLVENPTEAAVVGRIRNLATDGRSLRSIASALNAEKVETKRGGRWHARTIGYLLRNDLHAETAMGGAA